MWSSQWKASDMNEVFLCNPAHRNNNLKHATQSEDVVSRQLKTAQSYIQPQTVDSMIGVFKLFEFFYNKSE